MKNRQSAQGKDFTSRNWEIKYKTSSGGPEHQAVSILHDFYIPVHIVTRVKLIN